MEPQAATLQCILWELLCSLGEKMGRTRPKPVAHSIDSKVIYTALKYHFPAFEIVVDWWQKLPQLSPLFNPCLWNVSFKFLLGGEIYSPSLASRLALWLDVANRKGRRGSVPTSELRLPRSCTFLLFLSEKSVQCHENTPVVVAR